MSIEESFKPFAERMRAEGLPELFIETFGDYYRQLTQGATGLIPEESIEPVVELPRADQLAEDLVDAGREALPQTVVIKLNGGLGTSMGLDRAKSLLRVRGDLTFLDIIARQALSDRVPLLLMNSFATDADSLALLRKYPALRSGAPLSFLQHKEPKIDCDSLAPASWPSDPSLEWCPPGHGDLYTALLTSGTLDRLVDDGITHAFVSNSDNLGAVLDLRILGYFASAGVPFMMEVADRTAMDRKGGHLARDRSGRLLLREAAQCPEQDEAAFQDITRHRFFNTNNLWLDLPAVRRALEERDGRLGLPMIRNKKTVDPRDPESPCVYQLETAMGSAVSVFRDAGALHVPRTRFAPVKTTNELLAVRSDAFVLTDAYRVVPNPARLDLPPLHITLDARFYRFAAQLDQRFPHGPPSFVACTRLVVEGDVTFGEGIVVKGDVLVRAPDGPAAVPDGTVLRGDVNL
jgi:UTP--glucose-1-phosphate uridylyltransferase